jgi:hypothetical protein
MEQSEAAGKTLLMRAAGWGGLSMTSSGKGKKRANEPAEHMLIGMISNAAEF